ncbi:hypothetical protein [Catelliglobosispora koreensis]|uniref:hypothetical protein n=1 Tax=Catelliglobosispora koreensis TaxID=129052 RepID=UPI00037F6F08|nr:hypothetical protein [Catelliglobosispora koreensis]
MTNKSTNVTGRRRRASWEAIGGITAIAGLVVAAVFGVLELLPDRQAPVDERLELVDLEFAPDAADVADLRGGDAYPRPVLLVTLRNPADDTAVLTGVKLVVRDLLRVPGCGLASGGDLGPTLNYDFKFPVAQGDWEETSPRNFAVAPRSADALSITMGPKQSDDHLVFLWRFSVYGVSAAGREAHWGDGIAINIHASPQGYEEYVWGERSPSITEVQVRACAGTRAKEIASYLAKHSDATLRHREIASLLTGFQSMAAK